MAPKLLQRRRAVRFGAYVAATAKAKARTKVQAKAKAAQEQARFVRGRVRRKQRRRALTDLNTLAGECALLSAQVAVKTAAPADVERLRVGEAAAAGRGADQQGFQRPRPVHGIP